MRKPYIVILLLICAILVAVGLYGVTCSRRSPDKGGESVKKEQKERESVSKNSADALLKVGMSASVPSQLKDYMGFSISFNKDNHTPNWVAWELLGSETDGAASRSNRFWTDTEIEGCAVGDDYRKSGYDRGHLCPAADQKWSDRAMEDCFVFSNMCPQDHSLNSGAWNTLENYERVWARRDSAILIVAGPLYEESDTRRIGPSGVRVPSAFFKVIAAPYLDSPRAIGFVFPNMTAPGNMQNYVMTVDEVEKLTGFDFFSGLPDDVENEIESKSSFKEWIRK